MQLWTSSGGGHSVRAYNGANLYHELATHLGALDFKFSNDSACWAKARSFFSTMDFVRKAMFDALNWRPARKNFYRPTFSRRVGGRDWNPGT